MESEPQVQPLSHRHRQWTFSLLLLLFVVALPFLYLYATGYRFSFGETSLVSTGGLYIGADRTGVAIYVDDELVEDTRIFRRAYYVQGLDPETHRITVQKKGHHTWVKELPVYPHLVTEAEAFNMPLYPEVRIISPWQTATGTAVLFEEPFTATTSDPVYVATTSPRLKQVFDPDPEFEVLFELFSTSTATSTEETLVNQMAGQVETLLGATTTATSSPEEATTTREWNNVRLYEDNGDLFAKWVGPRDGMPYYYCAEDFPPYSTTTASSTEDSLLKKEIRELAAAVDSVEETVELIHPVQTVPEDVTCEPVIQIHTQFQEVTAFDFFPGSTDLVVFALEDGVYVIEIDNRAWQNIQPLMLGEGLDMRVENGQIYVYDGTLIYQIILE